MVPFQSMLNVLDRTVIGQWIARDRHREVTRPSVEPTEHRNCVLGSPGTPRWTFHSTPASCSRANTRPYECPAGDVANTHSSARGIPETVDPPRNRCRQVLDQHIGFSVSRRGTADALAAPDAGVRVGFAIAALIHRVNGPCRPAFGRARLDLRASDQHTAAVDRISQACDFAAAPARP
jgi:hypothetical protein